MQLYRALDAVMPAYRALFAAHNLTEPQWRVLRVVWECQKTTPHMVSGATPLHVSEATLISAQSLVGIVDRMVAKGLLTRLRSVDDRRMVYLLPTPKARALAETVLPKVDAIRADIADRLTEAEWETLGALLSKAGGTKPNEKTQVENERTAG
ncbi:MAG: MarR family transcriptional regulator [Pseudomonadota bacterium]